MNSFLKENKSIAYFLAISAAVMFSSKAVMIKLSYEYDVDRLTILTLRLGFAFPIYVIINTLRSKKEDTTTVSSKDWLLIIFLGFIGYYISSYLDFWGLQYISAGLERLILFVYPTITTILAALILKKKITTKQIIAIAIAYFGIFISFQDNMEGNTNIWLGSLLVFLSALTYAFYLVGADKLIPKYGAIRFTSYCMIVSCIVVFIHFSIEQPSNLFNLSWEVYLLGFILSIFCTVLPTYMIGEAIKRIGASSTSILSTAGPVSVIFIAYFVLGEPITSTQIMGTIVVIAGIVYLTRR
ncbi:MAG: DMT family transporter [Bacteroidetes bacterium]|nr:DMT family transporter [Bacteroidota bacterium]